MMISDDIQALIAKPEKLSQGTLYELRNLVARYPYFQTARLLFLKNLYLLHDISFGEELQKSVLYIADRKVLFYLIEGDKYHLTARQKIIAEKFEADQPDFDRTLSLINSFLASVPESKESNLSLSLDYTPYLLEEETSDKGDVCEESASIPTLKHQELIDGFIQKSEIESPLHIHEEEEDESSEDSVAFPDENEDEESYFTETLARIYVKQKRYSKALEIIKKLSLKYPKKNAYFADQIRFLEKLIINTKSQ